MRNHLNEHGTGFHPGAIPASFIHAHNYSQCSECDRIVYNRFRGTCPKCRPRRWAREDIDTLRTMASAANASAATAAPSNPGSSTAAGGVLSFLELDIIHGRFIPTVRHVPKALRRLWALCLSRAVARAVGANDISAWSELQMLPKCVLCTPPPRRQKSPEAAARVATRSS